MFSKHLINNTHIKLCGSHGIKTLFAKQIHIEYIYTQAQLFWKNMNIVIQIAVKIVVLVYVFFFINLIFYNDGRSEWEGWRLSKNWVHLCILYVTAYYSTCATACISEGHDYPAPEQVLTQAFGFLPPTREIWMEFQLLQLGPAPLIAAYLEEWAS